MGSIPRDILREHGYPTEWLGKRRIWGIAQCIKRNMRLSEIFAIFKAQAGALENPKADAFLMFHYAADMTYYTTD